MNLICEFLDRMKQSARCGMLLCRGQQNGEEESDQESLTMAYSRQMQARNCKMAEQRHPSPSHSKQVFSFKLNSFRKYQHSDKNRPELDPPTHPTSENTMKMTHYKSSEKKICKPSCVVYANQTNLARFYCSPPSRTRQINPLVRLEKMSMMFKSVQIGQSVPSLRMEKAESRLERISEMQTNLGNETERTLIDCLKEENNWDRQTVSREEIQPTESRQQQPLQFKNQQHITRICSPAARIPTIKSSHMFIQHKLILS